MVRGGVLARKCRDLAAIAADCHRAPAAAMRARRVVKEESTVGIGTEAQARSRTFCDNLCSGAGHRCQQPIQAALTSDKLHPPSACIGDEFVVAFGDAQDFVDWLDPFRGDSLFAKQCSERPAQRGAKPLGLQ